MGNSGLKYSPAYSPAPQRSVRVICWDLGMIWDGRSFQMGRKVHTPEQIIGKLGEAEVLLS